MAVTKIHPIKSTLKKVIDYICNEDKTSDGIYVSTNLCSREHAHEEFKLTKEEFNSRTKTLAHHLIQPFAPGEVSFEEAHQVGLELCDSILENKYEYVFATHIDKGHVHTSTMKHKRESMKLERENSQIGMIGIRTKRRRALSQNFNLISTE